jgi:hypothetical protein
MKSHRILIRSDTKNGNKINDNKFLRLINIGNVPLTLFNISYLSFYLWPNTLSMRKSFLILMVVLSALWPCLSAQDSVSNGRALNIPFRKYGVSIGNSYRFNGIRINFADSNVQRINGLNLTLWTKYKSVYNKDATINGISIGVFPTVRRMQPLNIFILGAAGVEYLNGISVAGIGMASARINGLGIGGAMLGGEVINGITVSGLFSYCEKSINGFNISGLAMLTRGDINGFASGIAGVYSEGSIRGMAVTAGYLKAGTTTGITLSGYANINQVNGLSIALLNRTKELHGLQIGILNFTGNNRRGLRLLPIINFHP